MKLSNNQLNSLQERDVQVPSYDRNQVKTGVIHIGPGNFAGGHLFRVFEEVLESGDLRWGVKAISLRTSDVRDALKEQDYLYSLVEQGADTDERRIIGCLQDILYAKEDPRDSLEAFMDLDVKLVTMAISEAGYGFGANDTGLDLSDPEIQAEIRAGQREATTIDLLIAAIKGRWEAGLSPLTIMSCDNMIGNGTRLKNAVLQRASQVDSDLRDYIEQNVAFPSTMVDRIVPQTSRSQIFTNNSVIGVADKRPICTEPFLQWIIEDNFSGVMPELDGILPDVRVVDDVYPWEEMKIRMLNGGHMALACVGRLAGYEQTHEAMADPAIEGFIRGFMQESANTLEPMDGVSYTDYIDALVQRLKNPKMCDELSRLARNGTQKIGPRVLDALKIAIAKETDWNCLAYVTAAWMHYLKGQSPDGSKFDIVDGNAVENGLQSLARNSGGQIGPILNACQAFDAGLQGNTKFTQKVQAYVTQIQRSGIKGSISKLDIGGDQPSIRAAKIANTKS